VFLTGAAVLIFEVAAVRMLAPYFGSSLYVLSSVLTTILAALSLGYYLGGRIADRLPHPTILYIIIASSGLLMLLLLVLSQYILPGANNIFSITTGPLILSLTLFFIPAFLLGIDSPFVITLLTQNELGRNNGSVVGSTFFFSTVGSIVGSIASGFILIPHLGLTTTITLVSISLIVWALAALLILKYLDSSTPEPLLFGKKIPLALIYIISLTALIYLSFLTLTSKVSPQNLVTLYQKDGFYSNIHIFETQRGDTTYRFLKNDVNSSSAIIPGSTEPVFMYTQLADIFVENKVNAMNYLVLGGGSYTIPRFINAAYPGITIDVAEVEPGLFALAQQYYELPVTNNIRNHVGDARVFLQSTTTKYDVIFSDVMNSGLFIPPHLSTIEFFSDLKNSLAPSGIAIINFVGSLDMSQKSLTGSMLKTIAHVFPNHTLLALKGPNYSDTQNMLFVLRHENMSITIAPREVKDHFGGTISIASDLVVATKKLDLSNQVVFTDDKSEVEPLILKQFAKLKL
jgi:spermidine synthase